MTALTETLFGGETLGTRFAAFRAELADKAAKRAIFRQTYNELQNLSSRDLADLGISRSEITRIAHEAAYGA